jgi:nitrite reductase/ring-hydroxylating ferredoxin subunit
MFPGEMAIVEVNGEEVVIANVDGEFVASPTNVCPRRPARRWTLSRVAR